MSTRTACPDCGWIDHLFGDEPDLAIEECENCANEAADQRVKDIHDVLRAAGIWPRLYVDDYDDKQVCIARVCWHDWLLDERCCKYDAVFERRMVCSPGWVNNADVFGRIADWLRWHGDALDTLAGQTLSSGGWIAPGTVETGAGASFDREIGGEA